MRKQFSRTVLSLAIGALCVTGTALAQAPARGPGGGGGGAGAGAPQATGGVAVANPMYTSVVMETTINRPAEEVWKRVGKYCDIQEWFPGLACTIVSGKDGEVGVVRSVGREIMVAKTDLSYTYTQPVRDGRPYDMYHGTLEAKPLTPTTTKIIYTLMWDNSMLADDAARDADRTRRRTQFQGAVDNMKILAEGGTLPAARGGAGGAPRGGAGGPGGGGAPRGGGAGGPGGGGAPRGGPGGPGGGPRQQ